MNYIVNQNHPVTVNSKQYNEAQQEYVYFYIL